MFVLLSLKLCVNGTDGAYPLPGVKGEAIVALGRSGYLNNEKLIIVKCKLIEKKFNYINKNYLNYII